MTGALHRLDIRREREAHYVGECWTKQIGPRLWEVKDDFAFIDELGRCIIVHSGDRTDLASIPRPLWTILPPFGNYTDDAVVHDMAYRHNEVCKYDRQGVCTDIVKGTREVMDDIFLRAMCCPPLIVSPRKRIIIYRFVRWFGKSSWNNHREKEAPHGTSVPA